MEDKPTIVPKGRYQLKYRGTKCLNCGHPLDMSDKFCPSCSQANSTKKLTLKDFFDEFFSSLISYDSKLLKTLKAMLLRPGRITLDYVSGKRVSYTNPFRFLLSLAIVYFLMLSFSGNYDALDRYGMENTDGQLVMDGPMNFTMSSMAEEADEAAGVIDSLRLTETASRQQELEARRDSIRASDPKAYFTSLGDSTLLDRIGYKRDLFVALIQKDTLYSFEEINSKYEIEDRYENRVAFGMANSILKVSQEPGSFVNSLMAKLPFATFFFLPVFALFIWLVYIRKKYTYTDNLIFSFHNQSLLFILLIISFLVDSVFNIDSSWLFFLIFAFYLYKSMRKFYGQGRFKTILKYVFLNTIFFILASVAALVLLLGSAFTY
ncbi:DUF3667 domain-containing protein [Flavobacteriaceae bacterium R33]|uniref:DUF3667 domain-containing protein n=2 Tax=Poritiphilus flavus TaxID=2697053 RepID=A0A6L9EIU3_9FLAO|nr:DUF3667 domain-containing protein [Poritiphilus flavus]